MSAISGGLTKTTEEHDRAAGHGHRASLPAGLAAALVFYAGGSVLILEVVGLRLVAPYVGISLQSSSAVIGVALAGIALGAYTGGRLADEVGPRRMLPWALVVAGAATCVTLPLVRTAGSTLQHDDPVSITILAILAVFVPSLCMASVTPMVIKLQLSDLDRTGTVVGRLSGIGTLGGILATFVTGFVLLAALPTSAIVVSLGVVAVLLGIGLGVGRGVWRRPPLAVVLLGLISAALPVSTPSPCTVETAYHCARVLDDPARSTGRLLVLDNLLQSYADQRDPAYLSFPYVQVIASVADVARPAGEPLSALHLGAGGLTIPRYLRATRPGSISRVLEIDGGVPALDRAHLIPQPIPGVEVDVGDARVGLVEERPATRDLVVGDAFSGLAVPWHLTTREVVAEIARILRPDGFYAVNVIDFPPNAFVRAEVATIEAVFPNVAVVCDPDALAGQAGGNFVVVASGRRLPLIALSQRLEQRRTPVRVAGRDETRRFAAGSPVLRDDYAPVDQLITHPAS